MTDFRVLTDSDVQSILRNSDKAEIERFAATLLSTLHKYATEDEAQYQPHRVNVTRPNGQVSLFMPSSSPEYLGIKIVGLPTPGSKAETHTAKGQTKAPTLEVTLTLCDANGRAEGILNAAELTAFRTSLGAMLLFKDRTAVKHVVMFGSGKQAYWHLRLAIILRGADIETITVVNRSRPRAEDLIRDIHESGLLEHNRHISLSALVGDHPDYKNQLKSTVTSADTIHCAVPSKEPLFPADWLASEPLLDRNLYISAIGSYTLDMRELDPELIKQIVGGPEPESAGASFKRSIVVDSRDACSQEAGELYAAGVADAQMLQIGQLEPHLAGTGSMGKDVDDWLKSGLVVYKSVGIGLMDLCVGTELVKMAREKGIGVSVPKF